MWPIPANQHGDPRYRAINCDVVDAEIPGDGSGVLVDDSGEVRALWLPFLCQTDEDNTTLPQCRGLRASVLLPVISRIQQGQQPYPRILAAEFRCVDMDEARTMGVDEEWISKVLESNNHSHDLFKVARLTCLGQTHLLQENDIVLTLNGKLATKASDFDVTESDTVMSAVIVRKGIEMSLQCPTVVADSLETNHLVQFSGAVLQTPHHAVRQQITKLHSNIYVSAVAPGSPTESHLPAQSFIISVEGTLIQDINEFLEISNENSSNHGMSFPISSSTSDAYSRRITTDICLGIVTLANIEKKITIKRDEHYFPTIEWIKDSTSELCGWRREKHSNDGSVVVADTPA